MLKSTIAKILMLSLPLIIMVIFVVFLVRLGTSVLPISTANLSPTPTPIPTIEQPVSIWAKDEQVIKAENDLKQIEENLEKVDLKEVGLRPPALDFEVKF